MSDRKGKYMGKILLVYNPVSGKDSERKDPDHIVRVFGRHGFEVTKTVTTCSGDATRLVKENLDGHEAVICCGGDGTFSETVNGVMALGEKKPIMYLPSGSTNDFAATVGASRSVEKQIDLYKKGYLNNYDIGKFNDNYFSYIASFGVASDSAYVTSQKFKNLLGHTAYILECFVFRLPHYIKTLRAYNMKIEYDGGVIEDGFYFGAVSNTNRVGGFFGYDKMGVKLNDGEFECLFVRGVKSVPDLFYLVKKIRDQNYDGGQIITFKTKHLKITCNDEVAWTFDGEYGGKHTNVDIDVLPSAINIVSPPSDFFVTDKEPYDLEGKVFDDELKKKKLEFKKKKDEDKVAE